MGFKGNITELPRHETGTSSAPCKIFTSSGFVIPSNFKKLRPERKESVPEIVILPALTEIPSGLEGDEHEHKTATILMAEMMKRTFWLIILLGINVHIGLAQKNTSIESQKGNFHPDLKAVFWFQQSAELKALYYQAYQLATWRLEQLQSKEKKGKRAVVLDIDETILDNSPYQAAVVTRGVVFPDGWREWVNLAQADVLPGAKSFLEKAVELGFEPFYITNRTDEEKAATIKNLKEKGIPLADDIHVITKSSTNDKTQRRAQIAKTHEIVLLIGDNLGDFDEIFQRKSNTVRKNEVEKLKDEFGKRFIIVPNPMYGEWEGASFGFDYKKSLIEKSKMQQDSLRVATWD